ncbi:helix-turn-helix domain-containing protein [Nocardia pseudovaccinii]|uniref:helix-turn-helix domain-containing protein n=1 Tax=Nocardia pseudovaccinii TaxID=189540 RepID=UPI0007A39298|nr:helix-turn-helix transcriptional regulator [Nocardia pseudovaccinii]
MSSSENAFGREVRRLREQRKLTVGQLATRLSYTQPYLSLIERGDRPPPSALAAHLDDVLEADGALLALAAAQALRRRLDTAADESTELARLAREEPVSELTRDKLFREVASIAQNYVHKPPLPLLNELLRTRTRIQQSLRLGPRPQRERDLCLLGAVTVQLLAEITDDLAGDTRAAMKHVAAAESLAAAAGHPGLEAWIAGTKALIVEWSPTPAKALGILEDATTWAPPGDHRMRLWALQARCAARVGDAALARSAAARAVAAAEETADGDEVSAFGGAMSFPVAKMACYLGGTFRRIGDHRDAEHWALDAIDRYASGPEALRSYGDEGLARIDVGLARIAIGEFEGAGEVLTPVLELSADRRIAPIMEGMHTITEALQSHRHADAPVARNLAEAITAYTARPLVLR